MKRILSAIALGAATMMTAATSTAPAAAQQGTEAEWALSFVEREAATIPRTLSDQSVPAAQRSEQFRTEMTRVADVPRITRFVPS